MGKERVSVTLDQDTKSKLIAYSNQTLIPVSRIVNLAITEYLNAIEKQESEKL